MSDLTPSSPKPPAMPVRTTLRGWRNNFVSQWNRFKAGFTRENIISNVKTFAWVIPLTLLIWIYAEREQVQTNENETVPFELVNNDPNRSVTLTPPQDKNLILELQGPQARVQEVLNKLRGGQMPDGLKIEIPSALEVDKANTLNALQLVRAQRIFADNGITVLGCQPPWLQVRVDQVVEREARIVRPPAAKNLDATFEPATVKIRGPLSLIAKAEQTARETDGGQLVVYADLSADALKQPGHYDLPGQGLPDVLLRKPQALEDDRVSIVQPSTKVRASIDVRQADKKLLIRSMPVTLDVSDGLLEKYKITDFRPVLQNVTVTGPPDVIDAMQRPDFEPKPKARVMVTQQDVGERRSKPVKYDLPKGVDVADEDQNRTVEFRLVDRSTLAPSL